MKTTPHASAAARHLLSAFFPWMVLWVPCSAAITPDSIEKTWPANPGKHRVAIRREAVDAAAAKRIATAEAVLPVAAALRKAIGDGPEPKDASQWWYREELGIRIPFAVTAGTVEYFSKLVENYGKQEFKRYIEPASNLDYHASVASHAKFEHEGRKFTDVHVVTLKLVFDQNFAATGTEGMHFEKVRTVVLDADGKVLAISGDGPTEVPILAI